VTSVEEPVPTTHSGSLVQFEDVVKVFRNEGADCPVIQGATFDLIYGKSTSLVGLSGSGKSTLLSMAAGLMLPTSGRIMFEDVDICSLDEAARAQLRAKRIGVVMQSANLIPFLTATENLEFTIGLSPAVSGNIKRQRADRARSMLSELGLEHRMDHFPDRLSGGEAQRVALGMALINSPTLLLADEMTGELDPDTAEHVMDVVFQECGPRGLTLLFVTHSRALASRADHQLILRDGEVVAL
jgi:predicted ABC-type transport system involved in lysophospholipase L1 biosynthesis ATPase subunit